jgi:microcystin-dependent protein
VQNSTRRGIPYPDPIRDDQPDIPLHIKDLVNYLDLDTPFYTGTEAAKPAAGTLVEGAWYWATDSSVLYLNTGTWTGIAQKTSPALLGTPTAPTPAATDNSTQIATTAFVRTMLPPGVVVPYGGAAAPTGWLICDGSAVSRTTYSALFAIFGTQFGVGDGSTTFNLPDLRGRVPVGKNAGTFATLGSVGGEESHALTVAELAAHDHGAVTGATSAGTPAGTLDAVSAGTPAGTINSVSAGTPTGTVGSSSAGTPSGTINSVSAGTPAGTINAVSAGTPAGTINAVSAGTPGGSISSAGAHTHTISASISTPSQPADNYLSYPFGAQLFQGINASADSAGAHTHTFTGTAMGTHSHTFTGTAMGTHTHTFTGTALAGHSHTFTGDALAVHNHTWTGDAMTGHSHTFTGTALGTHTHTFTGTAMGTHTHSVSSQGGGNSHNNIQPYLVLNYIVKT